MDTMLPFFWEAKAKNHGFASFAALVGPFAYLLLTHVNPIFGLGCGRLPCRFSRKAAVCSRLVFL
jgi:hypothetical protein